MIGAGPPRTGTASLYWRELSVHYPQAPVLLSVRDSAQTWWESADATILPVAQHPEAWGAGDRNDFVVLLRRFTGAEDWDDRELLMHAYDAHVAAVRAETPPDRLVEWRVGDGWEPLCRAARRTGARGCLSARQQACRLGLSPSRCRKYAQADGAEVPHVA